MKTVVIRIGDQRIDIPDFALALACLHTLGQAAEVLRRDPGLTSITLERPLSWVVSIAVNH